MTGVFFEPELPYGELGEKDRWGRHIPKLFTDMAVGF